MQHSVKEDFITREQSSKGRLVWLDFITVPRARRAIIYANMMVFLGQFTGINAI